ncbi:tail protein X [Salinicola endophyticus]|uniref:tail protein X n=1 Tax=Salinicola endophyticus TaxID=1949083 RepID=UPI00387EC7F9
MPAPLIGAGLGRVECQSGGVRVPRTVSSLQGDTVDRLCQRHYGRTDLVVQVLAHNPGLCALGPRLPSATLVVLPDIASPPPTPRVVELWR